MGRDTVSSTADIKFPASPPSLVSPPTASPPAVLQTTLSTVHKLAMGPGPTSLSKMTSAASTASPPKEGFKNGNGRSDSHVSSANTGPAANSGPPANPASPGMPSNRSSVQPLGTKISPIVEKFSPNSGNIRSTETTREISSNSGPETTSKNAVEDSVSTSVPTIESVAGSSRRKEQETDDAAKHKGDLQTNEARPHRRSATVRPLRLSSSQQTTNNNLGPQNVAGTTVKAEETIPVAMLTNATTQVAKDPLVENTLTGREFRTEATSGIKQFAHAVPEGASSCIPERDTVLWSIKDFSAFRRAAKVSRLPPLVSPEVGSGCRVRLSLFDRKGHIAGVVELPLTKASRDGVAHFRISVVRPDLKVITRRKVEMRITGSSNKKLVTKQGQSVPFRLTRTRCLRNPRYDHLLIGDVLRIRIEFEYFPFDATVFRGFSALRRANGPGIEGPAGEIKAREDALDLLSDIRMFCREDPTQNVEIKRDDAVFHACRFLLCARSRRFRELFNGTTQGRSPGRKFLLPKNSTADAPSVPGAITLSSITVNDISPATMDMLLTYIHTDTCQWVQDFSVDILKVLDLFEASYLYGVDSLLQLLVRILAARVNTHNFFFLYEMSERCDVQELRRVCTEFMDSMPGSQVASIMRTGTNSGCASLVPQPPGIAPSSAAPGDDLRNRT